MPTISRVFLIGSLLLFASCSEGTVTTGGQSSSESSSIASDVEVFSPAPDSIVKSPLAVSGKARGYWYFEANLPVSIEDENGTVLTQVGAMAESEWMTEDFVPFSTELVFTTNASRGFLVIHKDNPSGEPENDAETRIPVRFQ